MIEPTKIPFSLYIHVPWCVQKCPYCDFNSHPVRGNLPQKDYINTLLEELKAKQHLLQHRDIRTIFIGGGTPSLLKAEQYDRLFQGIDQISSLSKTIEITLEANPGAVDQAQFTGFRQAGINRLSIGVQSLQNDKLKKLGRIHDRDSALTAIKQAKASGFENFNLDLMFGLPNQTIDDALHDLALAIEQEPPHLSWYQLTLEPNTLFHKYPPKLPDDDLLWDMYIKGRQLLSDAGLNAYEISAYSQINKPCQHNLNYWQFGDYLGIGAGAHGKITLENGDILRQANIKHPKGYLSADHKIQTEHLIDQKDLALEFMLNALRLEQDLDLHLFQQRTGLSLESIQAPIKKAIELDLITQDKKLLHTTAHGKRYLNELLELFM